MNRPRVQAKKQVIDGIQFASGLEAKRYLELKLLERANEIFDLQTQVTFKLENTHTKVMCLERNQVRKYTPDFTYREKGNPDILIVEEVKGRMLRHHTWPLTVFKALYPEHELRIYPQKKRGKK